MNGKNTRRGLLVIFGALALLIVVIAIINYTINELTIGRIIVSLFAISIFVTLEYQVYILDKDYFDRLIEIRERVERDRKELNKEYNVEWPWKWLTQ